MTKGPEATDPFIPTNRADQALETTTLMTNSTNNQDRERLLAAALACARKGVAVWPARLKRGDDDKVQKVPVVDHTSAQCPNGEGRCGRFHATCHEPDLRRAFADPRATMILVPCDLNGYVVLDVDPRHGGTIPDGAPKTLLVSTMNKGWHLWYRAPGGPFHPPKYLGEGNGCEVKWAGYVILPPSPGYEYSHWVQPVDWPVDLWGRGQPKAPVDWDRYECMSLSWAYAVLEAACERVRTEADGEGRAGEGRNMRLNKEAWSCGLLVAASVLDGVEVEQELFAAAESNGFDGSFTAAAARATIRSGLTAALRKFKEERP
jgi:hypothetical protein